MTEKLREIIDQIKDTFLMRWEKFQETETYISLQEKYDNMSPSGQKISIFSIVFVLLLILFSIPFSWYTSSHEFEDGFLETRSSIEELLKISQESKNLPQQSLSMSSSEIKSQVEKSIQDRRIDKGQIIKINPTQFSNPIGSNLIPPQILAEGVEVQLKKINLKQIIDLNYDFDRISPSVKTIGLNISVNSEDSHYYDVLYRVSSFNVSDASGSVAPAPPNALETNPSRQPPPPRGR